jgi:hypothetical protein
VSGRVYQTAIEIGAKISKAFKGDAKNAADAIKNLAETTKKLQAAEKSAGAFRKLDDQLKRSKARYDIASESLRRLKDAEKAAGEVTKESTAWRKAGERELASASREFDRATKAAEKHAEVLREAGVDTRKIADEEFRLARALAATQQKHETLKRYETARERLFGARKEKTPLVQKAGEQVRGIANNVLFLGTAATGAGAIMAGLALKTLKAADEIGDTADKLKIGSTALQELRYGAQQSGAEVGALDKAIAKMAVNIGAHKLAKGKNKDGLTSVGGFQMFAPPSNDNAAAADPFKQIGLKAKELAKLKPDEQLKQIADGLAKLKTHAEKAAAAQAIFGKGAGEVLPFLEEGSAGIDKLSKAAHKYGGVLSEETVRAADEADKAMRDAEMAVGGLTATLGGALLPTITKTFKEFSVWVSSNREQIKKWAESVAKWIETKGLPAIKSIAAEVQSFAGKVISLVQGAAKLTGGFSNLAFIVAGLRLAPLALTMGKIGVETYKAAAALFRYAAASQAAKAAGMGGGGAPAVAGKAMGLAATASMLIGAATIGYAIGTALDQYFGLSDKLSSGFGKLTGQKEKLQAIEDAGASLNKTQLLRKSSDQRFAKFANKALISSYEKSGLSPEEAAYAAEHGGALPPKLRTGGGGGRVHVAPVINIHPKASRDDVAKGMDHAKQKTLEEFDRREAHRKRVSFGQ